MGQIFIHALHLLIFCMFVCFVVSVFEISGACDLGFLTLKISSHRAV